MPLAGLVMAAWAFLPPYSGPALNTETRVEVADHVVPGALLFAVSLTALVIGRRAPLTSRLSLLSAFVALSSGVWMTTTHLALVVQATRGEVGAGAAIYHTVPGVAVIIVGSVWIAVGRSDAPS